MKNLFLLLILFSATHFLSAQTIWEKNQTPSAVLQMPGEESLPTSFQLLELNTAVLKKAVSNAPLASNLVQRNNVAAQRNQQSCVDIPLPDGSIECFALEQTQLLPQVTQRRNNDIKTYRGRSLSNPKAIVHIVQTNDDFHLIGDSDQGTFLIDKVEKKDTKQPLYISYLAKDEQIEALECETAHEVERNAPVSSARNSESKKSFGTTLRKYRMAIMWSHVYTRKYDNNISQILARSAEIVADMNFICERDLCITFVLADNPEKIIFTDETTDPYDGELSSIFTTIRDSIGQANFDIGFGIAQGGNISYRGVTCEGQKSVTRSGDHIRAIAHELGHNMGAQHTFNYCEHGLAGIQVEVGSGHSIMSYNGTGVCGAGTVSGALVYRFHSRSVEEMYEQLYINTNCAEKIPTNNVPPVVGVPASGFYIPKSTPFVLTGTASDANTDLANLTYDWDQIDNGIGALPGQPNDKSPLFRLYAHSTSPTRTFPNIYNIVNNKYFSTGEKLPTISRSLNFRFQAQDNHPGGSGVAHEDLQFFVDGTKGPFVVTHPNLNETERIYSAGHDLNVTWDVANTQQAPVSCAIVNIYLSNDGGITYPFTLATNVPNDGAQQVVIPDAVGDNNRIKVAAADNIFFDISDRDFKIVAADTRDFVAYTDQATYDNCGSEEDITISLANYPLGTFDENISLSLTGLPANASLNMPSLINAEATTSITIGNIAQIPVGAYSLVLKLTAAGGGLSKNIPLQLTKQDNILTIAPDKAANFSGSSSRIVINKKSDFDFGTSGSFSVDLWLKPSNLDNTIRVIMGDYKLAKKIGWKLTMRDAKLYFSMERYNSKVEIISGKVLQNNKWQHIAVTVDRGVTNNVKVYRNGVVVASGGAGGIDITTPNALVVGAQDRYTKYEYNYKGQMDELNIWNRALSTEDVWKRAHVIVEHCDDGLISTYQFNETDGNQALDAFRGHHGRLGNVTREVSSAPFGKGAVSHQKEAAGLVNFAAAGFSAEYTKQRNIDVVASKIDLAPFNPSEGINPEDDILSGQYWIIRPYNGSADMEYDATFTLNDPISAQQASTAVAYKLYGRSVFSTGGWTFLTSASTADATNNSITFKGVKHYVQFLITRNEESLLFVEGEEELLFCATPQDAAGLQSYGISGINLPQDVAVTAPAGYQLATNPAGPFSPSLSLPLVDNALPYTLIYVKFEPTASGETQGIITHVAGTQSVDKTIKGIQVMPAQDIADQALQLDGTDAALKIVNGEDINLSGHTVELWFKPNWVDPFKHYNERWSTLFAKQQGTNSAISASVTGEQIRIRRGSSNTYIDHEFSSTRWYHLALVFSKNSTTVYINGVQLSNSAKAYNSGLSHYPIYLGGNGTDQFFEGKIDEFKIWNVGKSATQIREGMHLTSNLSSACEAGLRVYHQFDQMDSDGNMEDKLYYHPGTLVADAALAYSDVPAAEGVSVTKVVGDIGTYVFDKDGITTNLTIDYTTGAPSREVVVSYLTGEGAHGNFPTRGGLEDAYWIIKDYGIKEGGGMNVFIKNPAGWLINDNLTTNKVYKRRANAEDTNQWFEAGTVLDINLAEDIITLQDTVSNSLQLVPSRGYEGTCFDGILNGDEVDIDCGGSCPCVECDYTQIAYNNFDNGNAYTNSGRAQIYGIWNIPSNPTRLTTDAKWAKSGARSVKLSGNNSGGQGEFSTKNINLAGYDNLELDFWFTPTRFYRNNHVFYLEISTDGGASYSIVKTWEWSGEFTRNYNVFTFLDLPDDLEYTRYHENITINQPLTANTRLRFRTNLYYSAAVYLDNVKISTCKLPSCTDGVQNGTEVAIDCGGDCSSTCGLPTAMISGTTAVCKDEVAPAITFTGADGTAPYTFTYKINDGAAQTITTTAGNSTSVNHPTNVAGTFTYTLVRVQDADNGEQNQTGAVTATIEELPTASISGTTTVAQGAAAPNVTFTAADGTAPYTFTYKINNGAAQTITTTAGNSVSLTQSTASTGVFKYDLVSVTDDKGCSNAATGNALVTVNQLPTATISGTTAVCKDGVAPAITFTGANGTAPYTFTYKINDGTEQIITTSAGNTIAIDHPTNVAGIFTYTLVKVKDANNGEQNQTGTATATIEALPMASISGTTTVSQGDAAPNVTFTAAEGSAPYTFTYKINNGAAQSITTTAGNSVTVEQSTASVGMFEYELVSVTDNKSCSNAATGNAVVTVTANQLPTATISGTTTVCKDDTSPSITFIGANGTAPYTFTYKINDGAEKTITTTAGNSIAIDHPTNVAGTFTYTLVKVKDANNGEQNQMRTAITTVEELPTASISGTTTVAQGAAAPSVTFTAAEGNAPYTFTYKLNNGAAQTITTTASNTVTLTQSTANSGVFKYDLVSVTDNKGCSNAATGNAVVTVDGGGGSDCNTVINYSGFETGKWGFWKDGGRDARLTKAAPIAGSYSAILRKNSNTSVMTTKSLDLTMYNQIQVDFSYESIGFDNRSESFKLQVSTDNGSTFTTVNEWNLVDDFNNNETYEESVIINGPFSSTTKFRFRCNTNSVADAILLDNITVSGCQSTTGGGDNCLVGSVCDDGDATTINDVYDANCNCAGTPNSQGCTETDWINVAKGKPTSQSSTAFGGVSSRAVDGNTNGRWGQKSVTHTNFQNQAWWEVDLGQAVEIKDIRVWNRTDCCTNRLSDFDIIISNTQGGNDWMQHINNKPSPSVSVKPDKVGRYVRIQLKGTNYLSLAEVQVYTCPSQDLTENSSQSRRQIQPQLQFSAFKAKRAVDLQWVSNTGYKVASYEIERSDDGHNFHSIQQVPNTELTDELTFHSTTDAEPQKGVNFYRVKQIYSDGSHDYTEVQNIYFNIDLYTINIFPNPAQDELWIDLGQFTESKKSIRVFNRLGIAIEEITVSEMEGVQQLKLNTTSYQNGMYYLIIEADNQRISAQKFIIEHWK